MRHLNMLRIVAAIACPAIGSAAATELPSRKPGLWDMKMVFERDPPPPYTSRLCIDGETDRMIGATATNNICPKMDVQKVDDTYVIAAQCQIGSREDVSRFHGGAIRFTQHSVVTGDFNSAYTVDVSHLENGHKMQITVEARWIGACEPDQKPGDIMRNGRKTNIRDMQNVQTRAPQQ